MIPEKPITIQKIPYEENAFLERSSCYFGRIKVKTAEQKQYIKEHQKEIAENKKQMENMKECHKERNIDTDKIDFDNSLYVFRDFSTGKETYHYICCPAEAQNHYSEKQSRPIAFFSNFKSSSKECLKPSAKRLMTTEIIENILVFRFFVHNPKKFVPGKAVGFYEVFRICFKDYECWKEDRNNVYNFDISYLMYTGKLQNYYYSPYRFKQDEEKILQLYPELNKTKSYWNFPTFCTEYSKLIKTSTIYKNTPDVIKAHLKRYPQSRNNKNTTVHTKEYHTKNFRLLSNFYAGNENIRLYIYNRKTYLFGYNFKEQKWVSTKKRKFLAENDAIRCELLKYNYLIFEQAVKLGFYFPIEKSAFFPYVAKNSYEKWHNKSISLSEIKHMNLRDWFGVPKGVLKELKKYNYSWRNLKMILDAYHTPWMQEIVPDPVMRIQIARIARTVDFDEIIQVYQKNQKNILPFFKALLKLSPEDQYRTPNLYLDYLNFRTEANKISELNGYYYPECIKVSEIKFMHDVAYRDYLKTKKIKCEKKFLEVCNSKEYLQFLYQDADYSIIPAKDPRDLLYEGGVLSHCVGTYIDCMACEISYIYFLRKNNDINTPYYTLEVCKEDNAYVLKQCYGRDNRVVSEKKVKQFLHSWLENNNIINYTYRLAA